jgi:HEPN domain-containing protein
MQRDRILTARLWLSNAETDLTIAGEIAKRFAARSAFHAQQAAEMALKAVLIAIADDHPRTHVGGDLLDELGGLGESVPADVVAAANRLDFFYMGSCYPAALGGAVLRAVVAVNEAVAAAELARAVLTYARARIDAEAAGSA